MLIVSNDTKALLFGEGFWWFVETKYVASQSSAGIADMVGQYLWFLENELGIVARIYLDEKSDMNSDKVICAPDESLAMLRLMI